MNADGTVLHSGSSVTKVPRLIAELLEYGRLSGDHAVIVSSAVHFLIEYIHPFRDGNGRIGRLWQTLILSRWRPLFAWMPIETLIRERQGEYYRALQDSHEPVIDAAVFIDYMLGVITDALASFETRAFDAVDAVDVGEIVGEDVGVGDRIVLLLRADPRLSAAGLAVKLGVTSRTVERHLAALKGSGRIHREGTTRAGRWLVTD